MSRARAARTGLTWETRALRELQQRVQAPSAGRAAALAATAPTACDFSVTVRGLTTRAVRGIDAPAPGSQTAAGRHRRSRTVAAGHEADTCRLSSVFDTVLVPR
jgi:hypothetical protein